MVARGQVEITETWKNIPWSGGAGEEWGGGRLGLPPCPIKVKVHEGFQRKLKLQGETIQHGPVEIQDTQKMKGA